MNCEMVLVGVLILVVNGGLWMAERSRDKRRMLRERDERPRRAFE